MNKIKKISIITIILYCFFISSCLASTATVTVNAARLREKPNTTSNIITNVYKNEKVEILEVEGEWYKVKYGSNVGYLKNNLIKEDLNSVESDLDSTQTSNSSENTSSNSTNNQENTTDFSKIIITSSTNVRYVPNMMSNIIIKLESGKEISKVSQIGNWIQVTDGVFTGWILKNKTNIPENNQEVVDDTNPTDVNNENQSYENDTNLNKVENKLEENTIANNTTNTVTNTTNNNTNNNTENSNVNESSNVNKTAKVNVETAKVRETASKTAKVKGFLDYNDVITITAEEGEWYKFTEKSISGYVHKTLVTLTGQENVTSRSLTEERTSEVDDTTIDTAINNAVTDSLTSNSNDNAQTVVEYAKQYLGYPYVVGGKNPETGFDCSGLTRYVFLNFGYSLGATAATQNSLGTEVSKENLQPGDLMLFYDEGMTKIGHTGIYISNGDFIHAANPTRGVVIDNINTNSYYKERFIIARRIVE